VCFGTYWPIIREYNNCIKWLLSMLVSCMHKNCWEFFGVGYILDRIVHSKLEQLVVHSSACFTYSTLKNFQQSFCMHETNT
jgi:hypothetical protein